MIFVVDIIVRLYLTLCSKIFHKHLVHVIGDSHSLTFRVSRYFMVHHLGPATAFNLSKKNSSTNAGPKLIKILDHVGKHDIVMLCFGEIDSRIHIYAQYKKRKEQTQIQALIDDTIASYGETLLRVRKKHEDICVLGIPPAAKQENIFNVEFYASEEIRSAISREFNHKLTSFCLKNDMVYIDVYSEFADADGFIKKGYTDDGTHLNKKAVPFIIEHIKRNFQDNPFNK